MDLPLFYDKDVDRDFLKNRLIAVLGYGSQGQAHAQNLRDSGYRVIVAQRSPSPNHKLATEHKFEVVSPGEAADRADLLIFALPDEVAGDVFEKEIQEHLRAGQTLGFIHGFAVHFKTITPPENVDVVMIAPKGPGQLVRDAFTRGGGVACILGIHQDQSGNARKTALAWGAGIGGGKGGMIETTFEAECVADLFGEQTVLCGGVIELMKTAFDVLVEAGYPPEIAYFECAHEVKQIADLQYTAGLEGMRQKISNTASYGGLTRGPRIINPAMHREMHRILDEIRTGAFAAEWITECTAGKTTLKELEAAEAKSAFENAGRNIRSLTSKTAPDGRR